MRFELPAIQHGRSGFQALADLWAKTADLFFDDIEIDMGQTTWFDADMCAAFGAILYRLRENANAVRLANMPSGIERILSKNGFLSHYGRKKIPDRWGTTLPYQRFDAKDDRYFAAYIENELIRRGEMPNMSPGLLKRFRESIFEIFSNAVLHSRTELGIFSCGQFFPKRNRLDFSVADLGIGIRQNVKDNTGYEFSPEQAIIWATEEGHTTKQGLVPGGLGLKLLGEFIDLNGGSIRIVSDAGYWRRKGGKYNTELLPYPFPGTVVALEIDTTDTKSYRLSSEPNAANIF
uniref:Histidine kinase-, DNA gyrase B-, and HSP90-like ATPase n=1 Tax=Candidatus Kentrum sp. SD TaxID=2126332 RepID=A0A450YFS7_9GAMM|nr:MAG: Histidine kinase-, DNA gyrase B-, and HSP90-like ATPase [Candidatus Kentron sp. SD]VFK45977.1 MAG: Histidine kinase-, DNA gyrase B-, and HSP90-like ATPase [Candidatus Kentron sp. SD]